MKLSLEFSDTAFASLRQPPDAFGAALRVAACVKWYELGRISQVKAAELAGLSRAVFLDALHEHGVPAVQTEAVELARELAL